MTNKVRMLYKYNSIFVAGIIWRLLNFELQVDKMAEMLESLQMQLKQNAETSKVRLKSQDESLKYTICYNFCADDERLLGEYTP